MHIVKFGIAAFAFIIPRFIITRSHIVISRDSNLSIRLTSRTSIVSGAASHATTVHSRAIHEDRRTTPSCEAKSAGSNTFFAVYSNTAVANAGLNTSTASQAKENRPGFLPSWRKPKHGSSPRAAITRVIRATAIPTAKLWSACNGVSANRAVNCRDSSPTFPCLRPIYLVRKARHCSGGLKPLLKFISKYFHRRHHSCADLASQWRRSAVVLQAVRSARKAVWTGCHGLPL
jgi:hypothetical protein